MKLYDSLAAAPREFEPLRPGEVSIYVCGPTVQSAPHIGHLRSALVYDLLARWLDSRGLRVTLVRNVTDVDDKVIEKAVDQPWWQLAYENELAFAADYRRLGIRDVAYEPRATGHIPQMLAFIDLLIERGHAYAATDASANVYFDTASWPRYGELTNQKPDDLEGEIVAGGGKRNPQDFALWKAHKSNEPASASWPSRFGAGRPGWHIECSAMASHYLGGTFDIHGGGLDLRFPHHENELAQSAAAGLGYARFWMHNGLVQVAGHKMSKSVGNSISAAELFQEVAPEVVRYYLMSAHYRSVLDYQPGVLAEAESALERVYGFLERADRVLSVTQFSRRGESPQMPDEFVAQMDDDLNVPAALAVLHECVREGNTALDEEQLREAHRLRDEVEAMLGVLGLAPSDWTRTAVETAAQAALEALVRELIDQRNKARTEKNFTLADEIRQRLAASGIELSDDANTTHWSLS
jgi:cysteinyl-tRNA synthetase